MDPESMPKAHPHAALMAQYAQDAAETAEPWTRWECRDAYGRSWIGCNCSPFWHVGTIYRRKPDAPPAVGVKDAHELLQEWMDASGRSFLTGAATEDLLQLIRAARFTSPASKPKAPANNQGD